jgi:hypothetical protein
MTDQELTVEAARGRAVGLASVLTVAMFSLSILMTWLAQKDAAGHNSAEYLASLHEHKLAFILAGLFLAVGTLLSGGVLVHIILGARARSEVVPKVALYVAIAGPVLVALIFPVYTLATVAAAKDFVDSPIHTVAAAKHQLDSGAVAFTTTLYRFAQLLLGIAWVMTGVYGMRNGLLTRLIGSVAIAIGVANAIVPPFAALLELFWIGAIAIMLLTDGPQTPPAWKLGRPVSWREVAETGASLDNPADFKKSDQ